MHREARRWLGLIVVAVAAHGAVPAATARGSAQVLEAAFARESYPPRATAILRLYGGTRLVTVQILRSAPEQGRTRARDVMRGVAVDRRRWIGTRLAGSTFSVRIGNWPSGLYFARGGVQAVPREPLGRAQLALTIHDSIMKPKPVIWKPRYATRRMRERAWAAADLRREQAARARPRSRSLWARLLGR